MKRTAIYPGTFDPITYGHVDVIKKSLKIVDKLIVATTDSSDKEYLFSADERINILNKSLFNDLKLSKKRIKIVSFDELTVKLCKKFNASIIVRGLRAVSDFEYEFQMVGMNRALNDGIETVFLMADVNHQAIASKLVKEISRLGGDVSKFVPRSVNDAISNKFKV